MVDVSNYLNPESIITDLQAKTKEDAILELIDIIFENKTVQGYPLDREQVYKEVIARENLQATGIGNSLAFPHARVDGWGEFAIAMAVSKKGINFASPDGKPARFIFLMVSSPDEPYIILQSMSAIIRFLSEMGLGEDVPDNTRKIRQALEKLSKGDIKATEQILARDIATPVTDYVTLDTTVEEATRIMHLNRQDILPVVDEDKKFCGEISCLEIFEYGMPHFFKQLNTVSFIRHIDPFEKYFRIKGDLKVKDIFTKKSQSVKKDSTLLEIIFELTVRQRSKFFIVEEDGSLGGVIDRFCIIDKILFF